MSISLIDGLLVGVFIDIDDFMVCSLVFNVFTVDFLIFNFLLTGCAVLDVFLLDVFTVFDRIQ